MKPKQLDAPHLLIVDDDDRLRRLLSDFLKQKGFIPTTARNVGDADAILRLFDIDLIVLDNMMPKVSGLEFLSKLRENSVTPVIMLTALSELKDRLAGLSAGADDYLAKPFAPEELYLRIKAVLSRKSSKKTERIVLFGNLTFDQDSNQLSGVNGLIHLTETEELLLASLINAENEIKTREDLSKEFSAAPRSIDVLITRLRRKIEENPAKPRFIKTVRGVGYRFNNHA